MIGYQPQKLIFLTNHLDKSDLNNFGRMADLQPMSSSINILSSVLCHTPGLDGGTIHLNLPSGNTSLFKNIFVSKLAISLLGNLK